MPKDTNFDQHKHLFKNNIYNKPKGQIRLRLLLDDLLNRSGILDNKVSLSILDAGCGMGQVSLKLTQLGHNLDLCDISSEMLSLAKNEFDAANLTANFHHIAVQDLDESHTGKYDVIVFHAVLEWLKNPEDIIAELKKRLKPGGYISLMFYNKNAIVFYNLLKGNFNKVLTDDFKGHPGGLTPTNPIDPDDLDHWLTNNNITVLSKTGIRVLYDYMHKDIKANRSIEDIIKMESIYAHQSPFNMMGRYIHYICQLDD